MPHQPQGEEVNARSTRTRVHAVWLYDACLMPSGEDGGLFDLLDGDIA